MHCRLTAVHLDWKARFPLQQLDDLFGHRVEKVQDLTRLRDILQEVAESLQPSKLGVTL